MFKCQFLLFLLVSSYVIADNRYNFLETEINEADDVKLSFEEIVTKKG